MTLEDLLRTQINGKSPVTEADIEFSPDFRVSVQNLNATLKDKKGVHVIIHADGHNSETLDLFVRGNTAFKYI